MPHPLCDGLSYCLIDGDPIFLDLHANRYFRLKGEMKSSFDRYKCGIPTASDIEELVSAKILTKTQESALPTPETTHTQPTRSVIEDPNALVSTSPEALISAAKSVYVTMIQLRTMSLSRIVAKLASAQAQARMRSRMTSGGHERLMRLSSMYNRARISVPTKRICLLDSVAMIKFLAARGLHADLVFGVTAHPFSAHCWVQAGATVLNDTVGYAAAHTPIRVIS